MSSTPDGFGVPQFGSRIDRTQRQRYVLSSSVLLTAILCLVFVIILITILHLYVRYILRRQQAQRRRAQARFLRSAHVPGTADRQLQRPKTGLDPAVVASLPKFAYKKKDQLDQPEAAVPEDDDCSVCLSQLEGGETVRRLPACGHTFHDNCIDMWLYSHNTCPLCRKVVGPVAPTAAPPATVEVVVVFQAGGGSSGNHSSPRPMVAPATSSQMLMPAAAAACGVSGSGQGDSGQEVVSGAPSRLASFRRMFTLERAGVRRQQNGDEGPHRDLERQ